MNADLSAEPKSALLPLLLPLIAKTYGHPRPHQHRITVFSVRLGLAFVATAIIGQAVLAVTVAPLFLFTGGFTAILAVPLLLLSVIHPALTVKPEGVQLRPMFGTIHTFSWDTVQGVAPHPFIYNDPLVGKRLHGKNYRERRGFAVIVSREGKIGLWYRLFASITGVPDAFAFGITSTTHIDYDALEALFSAFGTVDLHSISDETG